MSDTPDTDAALAGRVQNNVNAEFSRKLERERDHARVKLTESELARERMRSALAALVSEIRAYSSPECDDEGTPGAEELKAADAALSDQPSSTLEKVKLALEYMGFLLAYLRLNMEGNERWAKAQKAHKEALALTGEQKL